MASDDDEDDDGGAPRPFWSGTIAFGLVSLPVSLYPANRGRALSLKMVDGEGNPLARRYFCEKEQVVLSRDDIVRGYKLDDDRWVVVEDEELEALEPKKSREIDLRRFVRLDAIDPMYFERAYFMVPEEGATKAYRLLAKSMEDEQRAGIATFVMRDKEYLCAIVSEKGILRAETLRFHDEVRTPEIVGLPAMARATKADVEAMRDSLRAFEAETFDRGELRDAYVQRVRAHVEGKLEAGRDVVKAPAEVVEAAIEDSNVVDLMEVLKQRLQGKPAGVPRDASTASREKPAAARKRGTGKARGGGARRSGSGGGAGGRGGAGNEPTSGLDAMTKDELYQRAQEIELPGRSRMSKQELLKALAGRG